MIVLKSKAEIGLMKEAGKVLIECFARLEDFIKPGVSTLEIADLVDKTMAEMGAINAEKGYGGFPGSACVSVNEVLVHGIPSSKKVLHDGDIVSVDLVAQKHGYMADACRTYPVGIVKEEHLRLIRETQECFEIAYKMLRPGIHLGDVCHAIEEHAHSCGYSVPREYTGHGIGREMHEDPYIPNYGRPGTGPILKEGMTLAIEPMVMEGKNSLRVLPDGWTAVTRDHKYAAHYENTVAITSTGAEILTRQEGEGS